MKKLITKTLALLLAAAFVLPLSAREIKRKIKPATGWNLYLPGKVNKKDVLKDLNKAGWQVSNSYDEHFSFVDSDLNGKKCLRFSTLDGKQDALILPLTGKEKLVTLIFKAKGSVDPDAGTTPYGIFYAYVQNGAWQTLLRHNSSNQVKGSNNMSRLRAPEGPGDIVSDWHDYRLVFDLREGPQNMKAFAYIDGVLRHSDTCKERTDFTKNADPKLDTSAINWDMMLGQGNYLEFGDNDGSTNAFGRYAYFLTVIDEDVSSMSLEEMGKKLKADLVTNPTTKNDPPPPSKRPAKKPAGINIQGPEVNSKDPVFYDTSTVKGKIKLNKLPYSRANAEVVTENGAVPDVKIAATVDPSGANGAYKTIKEAIDAVPEGSAIKVMPGFYYEKLKITKNGISLIGTNPSTTVIYGFEADTGGIDGRNGVDLAVGAGHVNFPVRMRFQLRGNLRRILINQIIQRNEDAFLDAVVFQVLAVQADTHDHFRVISAVEQQVQLFLAVLTGNCDQVNVNIGVFLHELENDIVLQVHNVALLRHEDGHGDRFSERKTGAHLQFFRHFGAGSGGEHEHGHQ